MHRYLFSRFKLATPSRSIPSQGGVDSTRFSWKERVRHFGRGRRVVKTLFATPSAPLTFYAGLGEAGGARAQRSTRETKSGGEFGWGGTSVKR
jgi:hypothetical protein